MKPNFLAFTGVVSSINTLNKIRSNRRFFKRKLLWTLYRRFFTVLAKQTEWFIKNASSQDRPAPVIPKTNCSVADCLIARFNCINWKAVYKLPFSCSEISKLIIFLFKLLMRCLATNNFLNKIDLRPDYYCPFCREERENQLSTFYGLIGETYFFFYRKKRKRTFKTG